VKSYKKSNSQKRTIDDINEDNEPELPRLLLSRLIKIWNTATKVREFTDRDLIKFSDNSCEVFKYTIKSVNL
jgi:hypothetical protein